MKSLTQFDKCKVDIGTDNKVFIWRKVREDWLLYCLASLPTCKFSLILWSCITYDRVGTVTVLSGNISAEKKKKNLFKDNLWPILASHFPDERYIFQDDNAPVHRGPNTSSPSRKSVQGRKQNSLYDLVGTKSRLEYYQECMVKT